MFKDLKDGSGFGDVKPTELPSPEQPPVLERPSTEDFKPKLEHIFISDSRNRDVTQSEASYDISEVETNTNKITLDDGTLVELPDYTSKSMQIVNESADDAPEYNDNEAQEYGEDGTRELTDDEKQELKDKLGWSDEKLKKCTIDENGVIHYKTDRSDLEGKTSENGVPYGRKQIEINGVVIEGVFPKFESVLNTELALDNFKTKVYAKECNVALKGAIKNAPELRKKFTEEQIKDIEEGRTPRGYVWHHSEEPGKCNLLRERTTTELLVEQLIQVATLYGGLIALRVSRKEKTSNEMHFQKYYCKYK